MGDLISRAAAIEAVMDEFKRIPTNAIRAKTRIEALPSAQPVLTCKGCKYDYYEYVQCRNCLRKERDLYEPE